MLSENRTEQSAAELTRYLLRCLEEEKIAEGSLLKKWESGSVTDGVYRLVCRGEYIENISVTLPTDQAR